MPSIGSLVIDLRAETASLTRNLAAARGEIRQTSDSMAKLQDFAKGMLTGFLSFETGKRLVGEYVSAVREAEQAQAKLDAVLKATGHSAGLTANQIDRLSTDLSKSSLFDDEAIKNAAAVMLTFRNVQGDTFRQGIRLAADMSAVMGQDLQASVVQLGKALNDPVNGLTALKRVGVQFNETQKDTIEGMVKVNDLAGAQKIILNELAAEFGGAAEGANTGLTGAITQAGIAWDNFLESLGKTEAKAGFIENMFRGLTKLLGGFTVETDPLVKAQEEMRRLNAAVAGEFARLQQPFANPGAKRAMEETLQADREKLMLVRAQVEAIQSLRAHEEAKAAASATAAKQQEDENRATASAAEATKKYREETERLIAAIKDAPAAPDFTAGLLTAQNLFNLKSGLVEEGDRGKHTRGLFGKIADDAAAQGDRAAKAWETAWTRSVENIQDTLAGFLTFTDQKIGNLQDLLLSVLQTINRIAAQMAAAKIIGAVTGVISGAAGGSSTKGGNGGGDIGKFGADQAATSAVSFSSAQAGPSLTREVHVHYAPRVQVQALDAPSVAAVLHQQGGTLARMFKKNLHEDPELRAMLRGRG